MKTQIKEYERLRWINLDADLPEIDPQNEGLRQRGSDIIDGLRRNPKTLPSRYFYDDLGSELFEQITDLPEYYPTRTEQAILDTYVSEIVALTGACELVELGSGSSRKTQTLLTAYSQLEDPLHYYPIDVSAGILRTTALQLLNDYPQLNVCGVAGTYERALANLPPRIIQNRMLMFLGSTMGNLDDRSCDLFLTQVQEALQPGEFFLLGVDLQKPIEILEAAYNDAQGVTAAFNLNILRHLNHRFAGDFNLDNFEHFAFFNTTASQIEMHLRSLTAQTAKLKDLDLEISLRSGETIHTEISRKFNLPALTDTLEAHALQPLKVWTDPQSWFGLILCQRQCLLANDCP
ncbi:L-histidine N(alpha)-methyltransferase [Chamaesiphon minutus]|uniref:Putative methyltransferase n=1 Tax=Chamaesiphon minutus (strain ATCC 27169 / PCC 6605) TaxID=1173020 RepID=K9UA42_CHAP6|nr:putative methyltransferase [Chamaesiphon minutus PCC 6605]